MKKAVQILVLFMLFWSCKPQAQQQQQQFSVLQLQSDYDSLRSALQEAHSGLYRYSTKDEVNRIFDRYRSQLDRPMTTLQFASVITGLLPEFRDGHLRVELDAATNSSLTAAKLFPLRIVTEGQKLMVLFNWTPDDRLIQPGMEITGINGYQPADLVKLFMSKISGDGFIETAKRKRAESSFGMLYWTLIGNDSIFNITAKDVAGKTITVKLNGVSRADRDKNSAANPVNSVIRKNMETIQWATDNISLRVINKDVAVLQVKSFSGQNFYNEIDNTFRSIKDQQIKSLVLDLRGNGGGVDNYGAYLVAQFMEKPFRYFDHIRMSSLDPSFTKLRPESIDNFRSGTMPDNAGGYLLTTKLHEGLGEQAPGKNPFTGKLVIVEDGGTFSTAADVMALLRHLTNAIFIGEESGGSYDGNTSGASARFVFPNSKFSLNVNMWDYYNAVRPAKNKGRGTMPDFAVGLTVNDLIKGNDAQWEKALLVAMDNR